MLITLDFETYFDPQFSLTKMSTMEYVKDERFKVWGVGIKVNDKPTEWYGEDETKAALLAIDWDLATLLCHNTPFDGTYLHNTTIYILSSTLILLQCLAVCILAKVLV